VPVRPSKRPREGLDEVERALSVLHGRHPEAVRAERETQAALDAKRVAAEAVSRSAAEQERRTWLRRGGIGVAAVGIAATLGVTYSRHAARSATLEAALAPAIALYAAHGFASAPVVRSGADTLELAVEEPTCFVALASRSPGDGSLHVDRPSGSLDGSDSIAWCTCGAERGSVRSGAPEAGSGFAVVRVAAAEVGADFGLYFLSPRPKVIATPDECSSASLDAWIEKGRAPVTPDDGALSTPLRDRLKENGFEVVGSASSTLPFAVVPKSPESCLLAWSTAPEDLLSLRLAASGGAGAQKPLVDVAHVLGVCGNEPKSVTVWRKGTGALVVVRVGAGRIGGTHGLREAAARLGLGKMTAWVADDDLGWDASSTLRASGVASPEISVSTDGSAAQHTRLVALSIAGAIVRADGKEDAWKCRPPLLPTSTDTVCVESVALGWRASGSVGRAGIAESTFPFWMSGLAGISDAAAFAAELSVLELGRRLVAEGFEPTTLEGVTETPLGARVTGRQGDDKIVALSLLRQAPWAAPCRSVDAGPPDSPDADLSAAWEGGEVVGALPLAPGAQVDLVCAPRVNDVHERKTVVFRHAVTAGAGR
jgi:hypothetical protein